MKQKLLNLGILSFLILAACLCLLPTPVEAMTGTGTIGDPFIISTPADLDDVRDNLTAYYELGADIDLGSWGNWDPIGVESWEGLTFQGHFDGKGHTISNLAASGTNHQGLFGVIGDGAVLMGITMTGVAVTATGDFAGGLVGECDCPFGESWVVTISDCHVQGMISGEEAVGGLVGFFEEGIVEDCSTDVAITSTSWNTGGLIGGVDSFETVGTIIRRCHAEGTITAGYDSAGGLIGWVEDGQVEDCWADVDIISAGDFAGGLIGWLDQGMGDTTGFKVERCYALGDVTCTDAAGGFIGWDTGRAVSECFSMGDVVITGTGASNAGGFTSVFEPTMSETSYIENCYSKGDVDASVCADVYGVGGFVGWNWADTWMGNEYSPTVRNCYSTGVVLVGAGSVDDYGGFCGVQDSDGFALATIDSCFWDNMTSAVAFDGNSYGGIGVALGKTTSLMKTESTFTTDNWDFTTIWCMPDAIDNDGYPILQNVLPAGLGWTCYVPYSGNPAAMFETYKQVTGSGKPLWYQALPSILKLLYVGFILLMAVAELRSKPKNQFPTLPDVKV